MNLNSRRTSLLILAITAIACSRTLLSLFNDPEGPNLLVVMGGAAVVYLFSLAVYAFDVPATGPKRLLLAILIQLLLAIGLYVLLRCTPVDIWGRGFELRALGV